MIREEDFAHQPAHNTGEEEHDTPDGKQPCHHGFAWFRLPDSGEDTAGEGMVVQNIAEDENGQGQNKGPDGQYIAFPSQSNSFSRINVTMDSS